MTAEVLGVVRASGWRAQYPGEVQRRFLWLVLGALVFIVLSVMLARFLATEGRERDAVTALLTKRNNGPVKIIRFDSETAYSIGDDEGWTRVVWAPDVNAPPIVQCVLVRRTGGLFSAREVRLLRLRPPLADSEGSC